MLFNPLYLAAICRESNLFVSLATPNIATCMDCKSLFSMMHWRTTAMQLFWRSKGEGCQCRKTGRHGETGGLVGLVSPTAGDQAARQASGRGGFSKLTATDTHWELYLTGIFIHQTIIFFKLLFTWFLLNRPTGPLKLQCPWVLFLCVPLHCKQTLLHGGLDTSGRRVYH